MSREHMIHKLCETALEGHFRYWLAWEQGSCVRRHPRNIVKPGWLEIQTRRTSVSRGAKAQLVRDSTRKTSRMTTRWRSSTGRTHLQEISTLVFASSPQIERTCNDLFRESAPTVSIASIVVLFQFSSFSTACTHPLNKPPPPIEQTITSGASSPRSSSWSLTSRTNVSLPAQTSGWSKGATYTYESRIRTGTTRGVSHGQLR